MPSTRETGCVDIAIAGEEDVHELAQLLWVHASPDEQEQQTVESFAVDLARWWDEHRETHFPFVARDGGNIVGMAWVALVPRVPRPGVTARLSADIQSVFVYADERGKGLGSGLVLAAVEHASRLGARRITVHSGRRAVAVYDRLGFASSRQLLQLPADEA